MHQEILNFISRFTENGRKTEVIDTFTNGCCYWFAEILRARFSRSEPFYADIVYDETANHFACRILGRDYDVTGDVTGQYRMQSWFNMSDESHKKRIRRDCVFF